MNWTIEQLFQQKQERQQLIEAIDYCGSYALKKQEDTVRSYKPDGTVLTEIDLYINSYLRDTVKRLYPQWGIISEETEAAHRKDCPGYFVIDPIDGTDIYSQGMPSWCIAVGILDAELNPVGGIIHAPRWGIGTPRGLFLTRFPGEGVFNHGEQVEPKSFSPPVKQIVACSNSYKNLDFRKFNGKVRTFGSNIIHIISPAVHSHIDACIFSPCYIWDVAAGHAVVQALGMDIFYQDGSPLDYPELSRRGKTEQTAYVGTPSMIESLKNCL